MHATILAYMFKLVECNKIKSPLGPSNVDNVLFIQEYVARLLKNAFRHLTDNQIKITVQGMFNLNQDIPAFKEHLRDFLIQIMVNFIVLCLFQSLVTSVLYYDLIFVTRNFKFSRNTREKMTRIFI